MGSKKEKQTCSYGCANTHFRSGDNNGMYKSWTEYSDELDGYWPGAYRRICFANHDKKCIICDEINIVAVHHYDENHKNNDSANLLPLCPTHHNYMHSRFKELIEPKIIEYIDNWKKSKQK